MHILVFGSQELSRSCRDVSLIIIIFALVHGTYIDIACCFCSFNAGAYTYKSFRGADVGYMGPPGESPLFGVATPVHTPNHTHHSRTRTTNANRTTTTHYTAFMPAHREPNKPMNKVKVVLVE